MTAEEVLERYERLHGLTTAMLQSARGGDWDALVQLERQCGGVLRPLIEVGDGPSLSAVQYARKAQVLKQILHDDAEIRSLTTEWMDKLQQFLGRSAREKAAQRLYGSNA